MLDAHENTGHLRVRKTYMKIRIITNSILFSKEYIQIVVESKSEDKKERKCLR